ARIRKSGRNDPVEMNPRASLLARLVNPTNPHRYPWGDQRMTSCAKAPVSAGTSGPPGAEKRAGPLTGVHRDKRVISLAMLIVTPILQELSASQCSCPPCAINANRELLFSVLCCDDTNLFGWQQ